MVRRVRHQIGLSLLALFGIILAIGLVSSANFFGQAVDTVILRSEMTEYTRITGRPPFFSRVFSPSMRLLPLSIERVEVLNAQIADTFSREIGLPLKQTTFQADSGRLELRAPGYEPGDDSQGVNIIYAADIAAHMTILEGRSMTDAPAGDRLEVWMHSDFADKTGMQADEHYELAPSKSLTSVPVRIAGIWRPVDAEDPYWMSNPDQSLGEKLLVRRNDYVNSLEPMLEPKVRSATWQVVLDEGAVIPADVRNYVRGYARAQTVVGSFLPDSQITTPTVSLDQFVDRQTSLTSLLLAFNIPGLGFLLYFLILTSAIIAYWQRKEMLVMLSRGMTRLDVLNFTLVDAAILFVLGLPLGLLLGVALARLMGYASSFLNFSEREALPVSYHGISVTLIALTFAALLVARTWTAIFGNWRQLIAQSREHYRPSTPPFWYRSYLDIILLIPVWYAYNQLIGRGSLALLVQDRPEDIYRDPLLVLAPALFVVVMALISMRIFRIAMFVLDRLAGWVRPVALHMALRQLGRQSHTYINPLLLVVVSLALGVYTLSMAASLDQWLIDRIYFSTGADLAFEPMRESDLFSENADSTPGGEWIPPIDEFATMPGVDGATRVGNYPAEVELASGQVRARFLGIDRIDFDKVAWFRRDLAPEPLGTLMNRLASSSQSILVPRTFLEANALRIGDPLAIDVFPEAGAKVKSTFLIAGIYEYFPTSDRETVMIIGNLDHIFAYFGITMPHDIWMHLAEDIEAKSVLAAVDEQMGVVTIGELNAGKILQEQLAQLERVGVFGTLSVSFMAATLMAALGLLTYSYASLAERRQQLAVLRAIGSSQGQVVRQVSAEYLLLILFGGVLGVGIGIMAAEAFVPLFRFAGGLEVPLPPLIPVIALDSVIPLTSIFVATMMLMQLVLVLLTMRNRLFSALRM